MLAAGWEVVYQVHNHCNQPTICLHRVFFDNIVPNHLMKYLIPYQISRDYHRISVLHHILRIRAPLDCYTRPFSFQITSDYHTSVDGVLDNIQRTKNIRMWLQPPNTLLQHNVYKLLSVT